MKKERMITRTIKMAEVRVMTVDTATADVRVYFYNIEPQENEEKYLKALKKEHETDTLKLVKIEAINVYETLYGMSERDFIMFARVLESR